MKDIQLQKTKVRKEMVAKRLTHDKKELREFSKIITKKLEETSEFKDAKTVLFYIPVRNEVDIMPLLLKALKTKTVLVPKVYGKTTLHLHKIESVDDLEIGSFYIPEAKEKCPTLDPDSVDLAIIPGIAFDRNNNRLGFGHGYYDRLIRKLKCPKIGVAYNFQILDSVPVEGHDEKLDRVITDHDK